MDTSPSDGLEQVDFKRMLEESLRSLSAWALLEGLGMESAERACRWAYHHGGEPLPKWATNRPEVVAALGRGP